MLIEKRSRVHPGQRSCAGRYDFWILTIITAVILLALVYTTLKIIDQSDSHVKSVTDMKIEHSAPNVWKPERNDCDLLLLKESERDPDAVMKKYRNLEFSEEGFKYFAKMTKLRVLTLSDCTVEDSWLVHLEKLPLQELTLAGSEITGKAGDSLAKLQGLRFLDVSRCKFDNEGVKKIVALPDLLLLSISDTDVTDECSRDVAKMNNLLELKAVGTQMTGASLRYLAATPKLRALHYAENKNISVRDAAELKNCKSLEELYLKRTGIKDDAVKELAQCQRLSTLGLEGDPITDASLVDLARAKSLTNLRLQGCTKITQEGVNNLRKQLPKCNIQTGEMSSPFADIPY